MQVNLIYYLSATVLGGFHALEPGHGKTVVAAYLIGSRGKKIDAVLLGLVVTLTHTFSVILLAIAAKVASTQITLTEESLHGYLGLVAGLLIVVVGLWMLMARIRGKEPFHFHSHDHGHSHDHDDLHGHGHPHPHSHDEDHGHVHEGHNRSVETHAGLHAHGHEHDVHGNHGHSHDHDDLHGHDHSHPHSHDEDHDHIHEGHNHIIEAPDGLRAHSHENEQGLQKSEVQSGRRLGYWRLFLLGVSGGLVPCPAAIAILLAAVGSGRLGEGLTYILLFSLGLAAVLIAVGVIVVGAGKLASRFLDAKKFARKISIASAAIITLIGVVTLLNSVRHII